MKTGNIAEKIIAYEIIANLMLYVAFIAVITILICSYVKYI